MSHVTIRPGEAGATKVAQGLLATAAALGLPADVVVWSPSLGGFKVPELVATTYAGVEDPDAVPDVGEHEDDSTQDATGAAAAAEAGTPRRYSDEEKAAAVAAVLQEGRTIASVAEELGASATSVSRWVTEAKAEGGAV